MFLAVSKSCSVPDGRRQLLHCIKMTEVIMIVRIKKTELG